MSGSGSSARVIALVVGAVAAVSFVGMVAFGILNLFVLDKYNAYGEVPIPGSAVVDLPAGEVTVNFHVLASGKGTAVPPLQMSIEPPPGGADPVVTDDLGGSVTINDDVHRQVWVMQVAEAGSYQVSVDGPVGGFREPRLAFGEDRSMDGPMWVFVALAIISADLGIAVLWMRRRRSAKAAAAVELPAASEFSTDDPYTPTDRGIRLEQLKTIAALRDSGALTEAEFKAEKKRILDGR